MELKDLIGEHELSGLDTIIIYDGGGYRFVLDGITYLAVEDPNDGYRSYLDELEISNDKVDYMFPPQRVFGKMNTDILEFYDFTTNKLVLAIGTDYSDSYYPSCVMIWNPQNLSINQ